MRTLLQDDRNGVLTIADVPPPLLRPGGVLVRTRASLISAGTERSTRELARKNLVAKALARPEEVSKVLTVARREGFAAARRKVEARLNVERALGYSSAGVVVEVGSEAVAQFSVGQPVACAGSGYASHAELVYVPKNLCAPVPDGVDLEAAAFTTMGAIALQGVRQADARLGERVAIVGLGLVGQLAAQILRAAGCGVVGIDLSEERCELALELGADRTVLSGPDTAARVRDFAPDGVDAVLLTAATRSSGPIELAATISRDRARVVVVGAVGMDISREPYYRKELELRLSRSYGPGRYDTLYEEQGVDYPLGYVRWTENRNMQAFLELLAKGAVRVAPLVSHRFPLDRAEEAYALVEGRTGAPALGVVFSFPEMDLDRTRRVDMPVARATVSIVDSPGIGLVGAGAFATSTLLPALRATANGNIRLRGVASAGGISARTVGRRFGFAFCASDATEVMRDLQTQAVMIVTRHDQHARLTVEALEAGKAVFVEKPLALTREQLRRVVAAQRAATRPVLVGFNRRYSPLARAVREHFGQRSEPVVATARVNAGFLPHEHWTQDPVEGGGRVLGEACHFVDLLSYLVGSPPAEVSADLLSDSGRYSGDNICATIRFADGSLGTLLYLANGDRGLAKEYIELSGAGRSAVIDDFREAELYASGRVRRVRVRDQDKGYRAEMATFVRVLTGYDGPTLAPFEESVASMLATIAIEESAAAHRPVRVDLNELGRIDHEDPVAEIRVGGACEEADE